MNKVAVYPGTFDPITYGHIDVIKKSLKLFDKVIVAVSDGANKKYLFKSVERIEIIKKAFFQDLKLDKKKIKIISEVRSRQKKPNYYLVLPWHFRKEILIREKKSKKSGIKFIFPLPNIKTF